MFFRVRAVRPSSSVVLFLALSIIFFNSALADIRIEHSGVREATSGKRIALTSGVSETNATQNAIKRVRAYFKAGGETRWHFVPMRNSGGGKDYSGLLPAPDVHTSEVHYRLIAVNGANQIAKTDVFKIEIDPDKKALARLQGKPPTDIKIDVSKIQDISDKFDEIKGHQRITEADRRSEKKMDSVPSPDARIEVRSEYKPDVIDVPGFQDYIDLYYAGPDEAFGVTAGIVDPAASVAGTSGAAAAAETVAAASSGGLGVGALLGGIAVAGGVAAASGGSSSSDSGSSGVDGTVSSRNVPITVADYNSIQDDFYDLYVNGSFIGPVNNIPGGSTTYNVTLNSGPNLIQLRLTEKKGKDTALEMNINNGEFKQKFYGSNDHSWTITAP